MSVAVCSVCLQRACFCAEGLPPPCLVAHLVEGAALNNFKGVGGRGPGPCGDREDGAEGRREEPVSPVVPGGFDGARRRRGNRSCPPEDPCPPTTTTTTTTAAALSPEQRGSQLQHHRSVCGISREKRLPALCQYAPRVMASCRAVSGKRTTPLNLVTGFFQCVHGELTTRPC